MLKLQRNAFNTCIKKSSLNTFQKRHVLISTVSPYIQINAPLTSTYEFRDTAKVEPFPVYRCIHEDGSLVDKNFTMPFDEATLIKMYKTMVLVSTIDEIYLRLQRAGVISFYMQNNGEEGVQVGSAMAWEKDDVLLFQYRELGVFLARGYTLQQIADQIFGNHKGHGKGRQMPVHYGSKDLNCVTISSPLATQMPQASGAAYALKRSGKKGVAVCYFGEGAASEGDAHPAFSFSATLECPVLWFCRNNAYAISTNSKEQYRGDGIAARAYGYGMYGTRFDGNDLFASYIVSKKAREISIENNRPILLEAMTFRASNHSTSDEASRYRAKDLEAFWKDEGSPINRIRLFLEKQTLWTEKQDLEYRKECQQQVTESYTNAKAQLLPHWTHLFTDVYDQLPWHLQEQQNDLKKYIEKYPDHYKMFNHNKQV